MAVYNLFLYLFFTVLQIIKIIFRYYLLKFRYFIYRCFFFTNHNHNVWNVLRILNHSEFNLLCCSFWKDFNSFLGILFEFWRILTIFKYYIFFELIIKFRWVFIKILVFLFKKTSFFLLNHNFKKKVLRFKELFFIFLILVVIHGVSFFFICFIILKQFVLLFYKLKIFFFFIYKKYPHVFFIGVYTTFPVIYVINFYQLKMIPYDDIELVTNSIKNMDKIQLPLQNSHNSIQPENLQISQHKTTNPEMTSSSSLTNSNLVKSLQIQLNNIKMEIQNLITEHKSCTDLERQTQLVEQVRQRYAVFNDLKKQMISFDTPFKRINFSRPLGTPFGFLQIRNNLDVVHQLPNEISPLKTKLIFNNWFSKIIKDGILSVYRKI